MSSELTNVHRHPALPSPANPSSLISMALHHGPSLEPQTTLVTIPAQSKDKIETQEEVLRVARQAILAKLPYEERCVASLGVHASPRLREHFEELRTFLITGLEAGKVKVPPLSIHRHIEELSRSFDRELAICSTRIANSLSIDFLRIQRVFRQFPERARGFVATCQLNLVHKLLTTGKSQKVFFEDKKPYRHEIKVRFYQGQLQIFTKRFVVSGATKRVYQAAVLAGPEINGTVGVPFIYAKPIKGDSPRVYLHNTEALKRELHWANLLQEQKSPNLIRMAPVFKGHGAQQSLKGAIMPLCDQGDLLCLLSHFSPPNLSSNIYREYLQIAQNIATALAGLHAKNIIHADIKPENIFLTATSHGITAVLGDLGLLLEAKEQHIGIRGTFPFIAPEIVDSMNEAWVPTAALDMWPFGLMLTEMVLGTKGSTVFSSPEKNFFAAPQPTKKQLLLQLRQEIVSQLTLSNPLHQLINELLSVDPKARPEATQAAARLAKIESTVRAEQYKY